jgi:hypothetical protein
VSLLLAGLVAVGTSGALMVGRWMARRRAGAEEETPKPEPEPESPEDAAARKEVEAEVPTKDESTPNVAVAEAKDAKPKARSRPGKHVRLDGFVCQLGDVIMRMTGEEAWLAGALVLSEDVPISVLFVAPDAGHDLVVYVKAAPNQGIYWLEPLDPSAILVGGAPPSSVEHGGVRFDRARRLPLRPARIGAGAPDAGDAVMVAEYVSAAAERLVVLKANSGRTYAYRGVELDPGSFEVIASGDTTLEAEAEE